MFLLIVAIMVLVQIISLVGYLHFEKDSVKLYFQRAGLFSFSFLAIPLLYIS